MNTMRTNQERRLNGKEVTAIVITTLNSERPRTLVIHYDGCTYARVLIDLLTVCPSHRNLSTRPNDAHALDLISTRSQTC